MSVDERRAGGRILHAMAAAEHLGVEALLPLSLENYHRLVEAGGFEGERVELLDGLLVRMSPKSERHEAATEFLLEWLMQHVDLERYVVGCQRALTIGDLRARAGPGRARARHAEALPPVERGAGDRGRRILAARRSRREGAAVRVGRDRRVLGARPRRAPGHRAPRAGQPTATGNASRCPPTGSWPASRCRYRHCAWPTRSTPNDSRARPRSRATTPTAW